MTKRFVEVPRNRLVDFLIAMGFTERVGGTGTELVYVRCHEKDPELVVNVYTSIAKSASVVRECGADAIRVTLVGKQRGSTIGIWKAKKILRTGTVERVLQRVRERAREAYQVANRMRQRERCKTCSFYRYADTGRCANAKCVTRQQ